MGNKIEVTPTQKKILDVINAAIVKKEEITLKEIVKRTGLSMSSVSAALSGRKDKSDGLYKKLPELKLIIAFNVRSRTKMEYDVSLIKRAAKEGRGESGDDR